MLIDSFVQIVIVILVLVLIDYAVQSIDIFEPIRKVARVIISIVAALYLLKMLLPLLGFSII